MISSAAVFHLGMFPDVILPGRLADRLTLPISLHRITSTCGAVGAVVTTKAEPSGWTDSHQAVSWAAVKDLPVSCADRTETLGWRTIALAISCCLLQNLAVVLWMSQPVGLRTHRVVCRRASSDDL